MYVSDYRQTYIINAEHFTIYKGQEAVELEDGSKEYNYYIYAQDTVKRIYLYKDFEESNRDYEFNEFIKALQGSRSFFQFGRATNWDEREDL